MRGSLKGTEFAVCASLDVEAPEGEVDEKLTELTICGSTASKKNPVPLCSTSESTAAAAFLDALTGILSEDAETGVATETAEVSADGAVSSTSTSIPSRLSVRTE